MSALEVPGDDYRRKQPTSVISWSTKMVARIQPADNAGPAVVSRSLRPTVQQRRWCGSPEYQVPLWW